MTQDNIYLISVIILIATFLIIGVFLLKRFSEKVNIFLRDTMKEKQANGYWKWSKGAIIVVTSWGTCEFMCLYSLIKEGFKIEVAVLMACIATGVPIAGAYAKHINPLVQAPSSTQTSETRVTEDSIKTTETNQ